MTLPAFARACARTRLAFLLVLASLLAAPARATDPGGGRIPPQRVMLPLPLRTQPAGPLPGDTLWLGHSHTDHRGTANPENLWVGNRNVTANQGAANPALAAWDFDSQVGLAARDSLQGWWPVRLTYDLSAAGLADRARPWWALDHGNRANALVAGDDPVHPRRPCGVVGVWHADPGSLADPLQTMRWAPIAGVGTAWCGLRASGDATVLDPLTGLPFDARVLDLGGLAGGACSAGTYANFPGYANQWDQMLYHDLTPVPGQDLVVSFLWRAALSTAVDEAVSTRTGWFDGDPLTVVAGNFVSSNDAGANAPRDSFMVYLGIPVDENNVYLSNFDEWPDIVYDPLRRWFDEVVQRFAPPGPAAPPPPLIELLAATGDHAGSVQSFSRTLAPSEWGPLAGYAGNPLPGVVRLVFRVKTNRSSSDEDTAGGAGESGFGYNSGSFGAAQIDEVSVTSGASTLLASGFESESEIDDLPTTSASAAWKSTGKPLPAYFHAINVGLTAPGWKDLCGVQDSPNRTCDMDGIVVNVGNADTGDALADPRWAALQEAQYGMVSPTIDLTSVPGGNSQGLTPDRVDPTDDYELAYEIYTGAFHGSGPSASGGFWNVGAQCWPVTQLDGVPCWSALRCCDYLLSDPGVHCYGDVQRLKANGLLVTSNATGMPDSLRVYLGVVTCCFRYALSVGCNSASGAYFDDIAVGFVDAAQPRAAGPLTVDPLDLFQDTFPVDGPGTADNVSPASAWFDTTTAYVKGGRNLYPLQSAATRLDVLADSVVVTAPDATGPDRAVRVDLVFRILPGPGNYQVAANRTSPPSASMKLLAVPTRQDLVVTPGDGSFWGSYLADPGAAATMPGNGDHHGHAWWDYLTWNSARCDTAESNLFPVAGHASDGLAIHGTRYSATYHEDDPKFAILGIPRPKCFLRDTALAAVDSNVVCDGVTVPAWLAAVPRARTGWDGTLVTREGTKIIPDGLLTPGAHVQYFFRKSLADGTGAPTLVPDTTLIAWQPGEDSYDMHRWQQFSVLPDMWKNAAFGGEGMACYLYVDLADRRGEEATWVALNDSAGGTGPADWGGYDGWHAAAGFDLHNSNPALAQAYVYGKNRQPGTTWDLVGVKGAEADIASGARIGARLAAAPAGGAGGAEGKQAAVGPKADVLRQFYHVLVLWSGDLNGHFLGPATNIPEDDIALLTDFLTNGSSGTSQPRGLFAAGDNFAQALGWAGTPQLTFLRDRLGASLRWRDYSQLVGSIVPSVGITTASPIGTGGSPYAIANTCDATLDVLSAPSLPGTSAVAWYQNLGANGPYVASVHHAPSTGSNWISLVDGFDLTHMPSQFCGDPPGRIGFYYRVMTNVFGSLCPSWGTPCSFGCCGPCCRVDVPPGGSGFADQLRLLGSVVRGPEARLEFELATTGRVRLRLFDVAGRRVRTLVDRVVVADGTAHQATWDGRDDSGRALPAGAYFLRIEFPDGVASPARLVLLR